MKGLDIITFSRASTYNLCRKKEHLKYGMGVRRESGEALRMGAAFHLGVHLIRLGMPLVDVVETIKRNYASMLAAAETKERSDGVEIERGKVTQLLIGWHMRWRDDPIEIVASELPFERTIKKPGNAHPLLAMRHAGKIDGIARVDGRLVLLETKTTSDKIELGSPFWQRFRIDAQVSWYMLAARKPGYDVQGVLVDAVRKPEISRKKSVPDLDEDGKKIVRDVLGFRLYKKNNEPMQSSNKERGWKLQTRMETVDEYLNRLREDIAERPEFYFARVEVPRTIRDLDEAALELWQTAQAMHLTYKTGHHYRNTGACNHPYNCEFLGVCESGTDLSTDPLPEGFERLDDIHPELSMEEPHASTTEGAAESATKYVSEHTVASYELDDELGNLAV